MRGQSWDLADFSMRETNGNKVYTTGSTWDTNLGEVVTVVGQSSKKRVRQGRHRDYVSYENSIVQFSTGQYGEYENTSVKGGRMKNALTPSVFGHGFHGIGTHTGKVGGVTSQVYSVWSGMIERCYSEKYQNKKTTYKGVVTDERWHNFQNFCDDIIFLVGYLEWTQAPGLWDIDKDVKQEGDKIYSKDTCCFLPQKFNTMVRDLSSRRYMLRKKGNYQATLYNGGKRSWKTVETAKEAEAISNKNKYEDFLWWLDNFDKPMSKEVKQLLTDYINKWYDGKQTS